eukprot:11946725-Alexandrium_andersonii.AAC.1
MPSSCLAVLLSPPALPLAPPPPLRRSSCHHVARRCCAHLPWLQTLLAAGGSHLRRGASGSTLEAASRSVQVASGCAGSSGSSAGTSRS